MATRKRTSTGDDEDSKKVKRKLANKSSPGVESSLHESATVSEHPQLRIYFSSAIKGDHKYLSNFAETPFYRADIRFQSVEHFFQFCKMVYIKNFKAAKHILRTTTPTIVKNLGKSPPKNGDFPKIEWARVSMHIMYWGLIFKFSKHDKLRQKLLNTGSSSLYEATTDQLWGIGIKEMNVPADHIDGPGRNFLGKMLMKVRQEFRDGKHTAISVYLDPIDGLINQYNNARETEESEEEGELFTPAKRGRGKGKGIMKSVDDSTEDGRGSKGGAELGEGSNVYAEGGQTTHGAAEDGFIVEDGYAESDLEYDPGDDTLFAKGSDEDEEGN